MRTENKKPLAGGQGAGKRFDRYSKYTPLNPPCQDLASFSESMAANGLSCPDAIVPDGKIHSFHVPGDKPGSKNSWYVFYGDNGLPTGTFGSWKIRETFKWSAKKISEMTISERAEYQKRIAEAKAARDEELRKVHLEAREKALRIWKATKQVGKHPYLENKGLTGSYSLHIGTDGRLIVPIGDLSRRLHSLQYISPDGEKRFLNGGAITGYFYPIDGTGDALLVCEDFATGATLHEATGYSVICAMNCGNLLPVCKILREKYPSKEIIICADDDFDKKDNPGLTKARTAAQTIGAKLVIPQFKDQEHRGTDFNDLHRIEGLEAVRLQIVEALKTEALEAEEGPKTAFDLAKERYPRTDFPWETLPEPITNSLRQLARSCATSPNSLPGAAFAILASTIGSTVSVCPKTGWDEPLIFWCADVRPSGEGKTAPPRALMSVLYDRQRKANERYELEKQEWEITPKKDRGLPPKPPRGFFTTDLTLEGLRVDHSGHGGKVCVLDELSAFITSQNQYKSKGSDRESWLALFDGHPARIVRAKETLYLTGCRISIFGGIQPRVWQGIFSEKDGFYLSDGTIYRFLPVYEGGSYHELTPESWSDENRSVWESLLRRSLEWADNQEDPKKLILSQKARDFFFDWRNTLYQEKLDLPAQVQGFSPKLVGYALRFAGILHLMDCFLKGSEVSLVISEATLRKAIQISHFYLGHTICALESIINKTEPPAEITEQARHLARVLESLRSELDSGRLAIGYIQERFNETCKPEQMIRSAKAMGALLRRCNLTIPGGTFNANGKRGVFCLQWDEKTNIFIETSPPSPPSPLIPQPCGLQPADIEKVKSAKSARVDVQGDDLRTWRTLKKQSPQPETGSITNKADMADMADIIYEKKEKKELEDFGAGCSDTNENLGEVLS